MKLELDETAKIDTTDTNTLGLNDSNMINTYQLQTEEVYDNIDLRIERDELVAKSDFPQITNKSSNKHRLKTYGNIYVFFLNKNGDPLIVIGPHCNFKFEFYL